MSQSNDDVSVLAELTESQRKEAMYRYEIIAPLLGLAIYGYFAQTEREYISLRTKQGLAAARVQGKVLGRPKGSRNKDRALDPFRAEILGYLERGLNIASIMKLINPQLEEPVTYNIYRYYQYLSLLCSD